MDDGDETELLQFESIIEMFSMSNYFFVYWFNRTLQKYDFFECVEERINRFFQQALV